MDPEFSDDEDVTPFLPSYLWAREQVYADALELAAKVSSATAEYLQMLAHRTAADHNFRVDQEDAADQARRSIEAITSTEES